jgi:hypothetical protein
MFKIKNGLDQLVAVVGFLGIHLDLLRRLLSHLSGDKVPCPGLQDFQIAFCAQSDDFYCGLGVQQVIIAVCVFYLLFFGVTSLESLKRHNTVAFIFSSLQVCGCSYSCKPGSLQPNTWSQQ